MLMVIFLPDTLEICGPYKGQHKENLGSQLLSALSAMSLARSMLFLY